MSPAEKKRVNRTALEAIYRTWLVPDQPIFVGKEVARIFNAATAQIPYREIASFLEGKGLEAESITVSTYRIGPVQSPAVDIGIRKSGTNYVTTYRLQSRLNRRRIEVVIDDYLAVIVDRTVDKKGTPVWYETYRCLPVHRLPSSKGYLPNSVYKFADELTAIEKDRSKHPVFWANVDTTSVDQWFTDDQVRQLHPLMDQARAEGHLTEELKSAITTFISK